MLGIKSIIYKKNNELLIIEIEDESNVLYKGISKKIEQKLVFNYLENLLAIIDTWQEEYNNSKILDGQDWKLSISFDNGYKKEYHGHGEFPINFEAFERLNHKLINEVM